MIWGGHPPLLRGIPPFQARRWSWNEWWLMLSTGLTQLSRAQAGSRLLSVRDHSSVPPHRAQQEAKWCNLVINLHEILTLDGIYFTHLLVCLFLQKRSTSSNFCPRCSIRLSDMKLHQRTRSWTNRAQSGQWVKHECLCHVINPKWRGWKRPCKGLMIRCAQEKECGLGYKEEWSLTGDVKDELGVN